MGSILPDLFFFCKCQFTPTSQPPAAKFGHKRLRVQGQGQIGHWECWDFLALLNGRQTFFWVCREHWPLLLKRWCDVVKHNLVSAWRWMGKKEEWSREGEGRGDERCWQKMASNAAKPTTRSLWRHHQVSQQKVNMLADVVELSSLLSKAQR